MVSLQNGSVVSIRDALSGATDSVSGLPLKFSMDESSGIPTYTVSIDDNDNKEVREYSFSLANAQVVVSLIRTPKEEIKKEEQKLKAEAKRPS